MTTEARRFDPVRFKATTRAQWNETAEAYHRWGPAIEKLLGAATETMLDLAGVAPGARVLDVAAGPGRQTLVAARRVGPTGYVLATDIAENMVRVAAEMARAAGLTNVETRVMDGEHLDLPPDSFDAVISRLGIMFFPDVRAALAGMRRVLRPGGRKGAIVFSTAEENPFFSIPISIIRRRAKLGPPLPGQPGPFSLGARGVMEDAYRSAGFRHVQVLAVPSSVRLDSAAECVRFEKAAFGALHQMLRGLPEADKDAVWDEVERDLRRFEGPEGFAAPAELLIGVGVK
jgi:ubiquinone/menaquinone biosynthesis C-methylase UbiE